MFWIVLGNNCKMDRSCCPPQTLSDRVSIDSPFSWWSKLKDVYLVLKSHAEVATFVPDE